jgi:hypothetical protein
MIPIYLHNVIDENVGLPPLIGITEGDVLILIPSDPPPLDCNPQFLILF